MASKKYKDYLSWVSYRNNEEKSNAIRLGIIPDIMIPTSYEDWKQIQIEIKSLDKRKNPMTFSEWKGF